MAIQENKELGEAIKRGDDTIEIAVGSDAGKTVVKIKATGKVAWAVCFSSLTVAVGAIIAGTIIAAPTAGAGGAAGLAVGGAAAAPAVVVLGTSAIGAITIAVAAGGVGALTKLRRYKMEKIADRIILRK